ncbi:unnamed protein product [Aphanomyces euteiches]
MTTSRWPSLSPLFLKISLVCVVCQIIYLRSLYASVNTVGLHFRPAAHRSNSSRNASSSPPFFALDFMNRSNSSFSSPLPSPTIPLKPPPTADSTSFQALFNLPAEQGFPSKFAHAKRGIVLSLHRAFVPIGASLVKELRALGNTDPIQIMHCLDSELPPSIRSFLVDLDPESIEIVDVCRVVVAANLLTEAVAKKFQNFWLKPLAVVVSPFDQVMLLDVDNIFAKDPAALWSMPPVVETGTLFFYDRVLPINFWLNQAMPDGRSYLSSFLETFPYHDFGLPPFQSRPRNCKTHEQDSSMVLLDKRVAGPTVLKVLWHLATSRRFHDPPFSWGDKESFWLAFELSQRPYRFSDWAASVVSKPEDLNEHKNTLCGSLAQFMPFEAEATATLLFVNGGEVIDLVESVGDMASNTTNWTERGQAAIQRVPRFVTPRRKRRAAMSMASRGMLDQTCLIDQGATDLDPAFIAILERRIHMVQDIA